MSLKSVSIFYHHQWKTGVWITISILLYVLEIWKNFPLLHIYIYIYGEKGNIQSLLGKACCKCHSTISNQDDEIALVHY